MKGGREAISCINLGGKDEASELKGLSQENSTFLTVKAENELQKKASHVINAVLV